MNLIPPSSQCPPDSCFEVVQVCWADGKGAVAGCSTIPVSVIAGNQPVTMSTNELLPIIGSLGLLIAVSWGIRQVADLIKFSRG